MLSEFGFLKVNELVPSAGIGSTASSAGRLVSIINSRLKYGISCVMPFIIH